MASLPRSKTSAESGLRNKDAYPWVPRVAQNNDLTSLDYYLKLTAKPFVIDNSNRSITGNSPELENG